MKKLVKRGALLVVVICSLAACQEELPTPENEPSEKSDPLKDIEGDPAGPR
ncbi:MAG: hypothetical protein AAGA66_10510 [Bacteroidota bacterium]